MCAGPIIDVLQQTVPRCKISGVLSSKSLCFFKLTFYNMVSHVL